MKRYKLIREYPGSPKLGFTVKFKTGYPFVSPVEIEAGIKCNLSLEECQNHPEFWELVVEKDYEILSFKGNSSKQLFVLKPDGFYTGQHPLEEMLDVTGSNDFSIHSVKRLSDGEVFTVGDKIKTSMSLTISSFIIIDNELLVDTFEIIGTVALNRITKAKQPLFTTEDGADIFEGDNYFQLALTFKPNFRYAIYKEIARPNIIYNYSIIEERKKLNDFGRYYFSTKEAAEEFSLMNKPCLSINDVMGAGYGIVSPNPLIKIVEKQIKNE